MKIISTIIISVAVLIGLWISLTNYLSYKGARVPIYQTEISDFEIQIWEIKNEEFAAYVQSNLRKLTDGQGVKTIKCFIFHQNVNRLIYRIIMVGNIQNTADLSENFTSVYQLNNEDIPLLSALKLCGVSPQKNEIYTQVSALLRNAGAIYINKNHIIFDQVAISKKYLESDEQKKAFLEQIIRTRSEKQK